MWGCTVMDDVYTCGRKKIAKLMMLNSIDEREKQFLSKLVTYGVSIENVNVHLNDARVLLDWLFKSFSETDIRMILGHLMHKS
jgi:hypothetical protein